MATARRFMGIRGLVVIVAVIAVAGNSRVMTRAADTTVPRYSFAVSIEGRQLGGFREVSGLDIELEVIEFRDGSGGPTQYLPGMTKYSNIKLVRAFNGGTELSDWFTAFSQSRTERVAGTIVMYDQAQTEIARWHFENAWPQKISGPKLNAGGNEVPIESIELVHEGLSRVAVTR